MTKKELQEDLLAKLNTLTEERIAQSLTRIIYEDYIEDTEQFPNDELTESEVAKVHGLLEELKKGHPVQYLVGKAMFYNMKLKVSPAVLIPRPETEELVFNLLQLLKAEAKQNDEEMKLASILDVGTGSGCISLVMQKEFPNAKVMAVDISKEALAIAKENAVAQELPVNFQQIDILDRSQWDKIPELDCLISNPPYIPNEEKKLMSPLVLEHEPQQALFVDDAEPLVFYEALAELGIEKLKSGGWMACEINEHRPSETMGVFILKAYTDLQVLKDMSGKYRILVGKKP